MKRFRDASWRAACLLLLLALTACGSVPSARVPTLEPTRQPSPVTIRFGTGDSGDGLVPLKNIIAGFERQYPWITVEVVPIVSDNYYGTLLDGIRDGSGPDVMQIGEDALPRFVETGGLENLTRYLDSADAPLDTNIYLPGVFRPGQWRNEPYLLPKDFSTIGVFYNKKLFDAAGVKYPGSGWTWQDFLETAQALTDPSKGQYGVQLPSSWPRGFEYWVNAAGGKLISDDGSRIEGFMNGEPVVKALRFYADLYHIHKVAVPIPSSNVFGTNLPDFGEGHAAMQLYGRWPQASYLQNPALKDALGVAPLPIGAHQANVIAWAGFGISANSTHKDASWLFVRYACGPAGAREWANWGLPAVKAVAEERGFSRDTLDKIWLDSLAQLRPLAAYSSPYWGEVGEPVLQQAIEQILSDPKADVQAVLDQAAKQAQRNLDARRSP